MFQIFRKLSKTDWLIIGSYWLVANIFIIPAYLFQQGIMKFVTISVFEIIMRTFIVVILVFYIFPNGIYRKKVILAIIYGSLLVAASTPLFMISDSFYSKSNIDWSSINFFKNILLQAQQIGVLGAVLAFKQYYNVQSYAYKLEKLNVENQLKALNNQVSPHFLFNNLNVLSGLISQNPLLAKEYLNRLAMIYRHLITNTNNDIVLLKDELTFADDYIYLLKFRFENAYIFDKVGDSTISINSYLPTCSLQFVLENIIKHNKGDNNQPLKTTITIDVTEIIITNQKKIKKPDYETTGFGLNNLRNRYELLSNKQLEIIENQHFFTVKLPLLQTTNYI